MADVIDQPAASSVRAVGQRRRRRLWLAAAVVVVLVGVGVAVGIGQRSGTEPVPVGPPAPAEGERLTRSDWDGTGLGVFRGTDPAEVTAFEQFLGAPVEFVADFSAREDWEQISAPDYLFEVWQGSGRRLVLALPMLPDDADGATMTAGARGEYDQYFRTLGEGLVAAGLEDTVLRIGWEFNLDSWPWSGSDAATYTAYWQRIAGAMMAVPGQAFRFDWNVNNAGSASPDPATYYPGDEYVDYIGVDAYDVDGRTYPKPDDCDAACADRYAQEAWDKTIYGGERGLRFWSEFAAQHDKQLSLPEWGVWDRYDDSGGDDNPAYIDKMADFIEDPANAVGYQAYFEDANEQGTHRLMTDLPASGERYVQRFGR